MFAVLILDSASGHAYTNNVDRFYRVWTVQELVLAEDACFCLGHLEVPLRKMDEIIIGALIESEDVRRHGLGSLFTYRDQIRGSGPEYRRHAENIPLTLARCFLGLARRRQCKDGRDRIYGMHGLLPDNGMLPDYSLSLKQVYVNFAAATLRSGDFSVLHACSLNFADPGMPSYIPGLANPNYTGIARDDFFRDRPFRAGLDRQTGFDTDETGYIHLKGTCVDIVHNTLDFSHKLKSVGDYYKLAETHIAAWSEECLTSQEDLELNKGLLERPLGYSRPQVCHILYAHNTRSSVISRTLFMVDLTHYTHYTHYTHKILFDLSLFSDLSPSLSSIDKQRWADRSLFFTTTGFLGLGPRGLQPGDKVVIFDGDYTPFILRPQLDTNNPNGQIYKIVGDCYLEGWMYDTFPDENVGGPPIHWTGADSEPQRAFKWVCDREGMQDEMPRLEERTFTIC
jgi:hypothetical protein